MENNEEQMEVVEIEERPSSPVIGGSNTQRNLRSRTPSGPVLGGNNSQRNLRSRRPAVVGNEAPAEAAVEAPPNESINQTAAEQDDNETEENPPRSHGSDAEDSETTEDNAENSNKRKEPGSDEEEDKDAGQSCPICMDLWTNSGEHRLCSLRCGHLFGHSCIIRWLKTGCNSGARRCPQCNHKAAAKDVRVLYARKLSAIDTCERDRLKEQLETVSLEKNRISMELARYEMRNKLFEQQLAGMKQRIVELESQQGERLHTIIPLTSSQSTSRKFYLDRSIDICKDGGCRVLAYNPWFELLIVSQKSTNRLFSGYGVKKIDALEFRPRQFVFLHSQAIRDVSFHPTMNEMLLSVGFDKCAKLMDVQNNVVVHSYQTDSQLWSCCWSGDNPNIFLAGAQNGSVSQFDIRQTSEAVSTQDGPGDRSPVVSLAAVPSNPGGAMGNGGFIACRLNTCFSYERKNSEYTSRQMFLEGPFISVSYDSQNKHVLVSSRPNARHPQARHVVCTIEKGNEEAIMCNIVHTFHGGHSQKLLSRPCHITTENDTFIAAHQESTSSVPIWSVSTGKQISNLPVSDPVLDLCSFQVKNNLFLATLSEKKLRLYTYGN